MIDEIKRLKVGSSITYHIGNFSYDSKKNETVGKIHSFILKTIYDVDAREGRLSPKKDCKYAIHQKKHYSGGFEYIIKRVKK